jgi:effector-binding domain-containing protein
MIDTPHITQIAAQTTAVVRLSNPPEEMRAVVGPGIGELMKTVAAQGVGPAGPWFIHMLRMTPEVWDFEIGVPVRSPVEPVGRVTASSLPAATVARTVHRGGYEGLPAAWGEFDAWIAKSGRKPAADLWDVYVVGPETSRNPADWRTEMNRPLVG